MLKTELLKCTFLCFELQSVWFQHNGAPAHKSSSMKQYLVEEFREQVIECGGFQQWPPHSPYLTPMDFSCGDTSNSRCMRSLRKHYRIFNDALRIPLQS
ncbi:hypothetical protein AVEN_248065-1 [Araneus ventricosus]|uniref:Tc1-like transposase DDE domain-containing protein n=1 Tax=Araneus ventricosus TaxID=182803 RepID=A0A4Y2KU57_ARAVE|nr:hypothetical protein AVEN_248065-1 [Araneus ventricosus]